VLHIFVTLFSSSPLSEVLCVRLLCMVGYISPMAGLLVVYVIVG